MWPEKSQSKVLENFYLPSIAFKVKVFLYSLYSIGPILYKCYIRNVPLTMDLRFRVPKGPIGKKLFVAQAVDDPFNSL